MLNQEFGGGNGFHRTRKETKGGTGNEDRNEIGRRHEGLPQVPGGSPLLGHRDVPSPHPHNLKIEITFLMTAIGNLYLQKTYSRTITRRTTKEWPF